MDTNILISFRPAVSELLEGAGTVPQLADFLTFSHLVIRCVTEIILQKNNFCRGHVVDQFAEFSEGTPIPPIRFEIRGSLVVFAHGIVYAL